jgi:two-component system response regulator FixJ
VEDGDVNAILCPSVSGADCQSRTRKIHGGITEKIHMIDSQRRHMFVVGESPLCQEDLDERLADGHISMECFDAVAPCREALEREPCDLLVIDLERYTREGLQLLSDLEETVSRVTSLALVSHGDIPAAVEAIKAGADHCLDRPLSAERLLTEITSLLREASQNGRPAEPTLTPTETTVLSLLLKGKTNSNIAQGLHRSPRTIEVHRRHIMRKLGVANVVDLVKTAASRGWLDQVDSG